MSPKASSGRTSLDLYIMNKVRELRISKGYSQAVLAVMMDVSDAFIGQVENVKGNKKYNLSHLNKLAQIFKCSPRDFLPEQPIE